MNFTELLEALSAETKLDLKDVKNGESCSIRFDDKVDVTLASAPEGVGVNLFAVLGTVSQEDRSILFPVLMQIHLLGLVTDDAYFSFDEAASQVTLFRTVQLAGMDRAAGMKAVESFVNQAMRWSAALPDLKNIPLHAAVNDMAGSGDPAAGSVLRPGASTTPTGSGPNAAGNGAPFVMPV
ncbi:hypothetical protein WM40_00960 [Robbsia andropogonis]|uniref:Type III secretion system chaperone n=1 Tax=Robbsia andropogonis TaxID=28092 RepID=A0A0F5K6S7_9BURK|nr:type III secretion system chaperone [Robbsia andropogonis]KKB65237.1 hypothetical protein WM40_00960 [Robbsia andropogonis]MCP1117135.1 type III secretion system chaperone [Robbsia andropogonis]MCP1128481.1 type III secretion system chaperone [Robbsia andropogonis]